jgi:hypothetical protein
MSDPITPEALAEIVAHHYYSPSPITAPVVQAVVEMLERICDPAMVTIAKAVAEDENKGLTSP